MLLEKEKILPEINQHFICVGGYLFACEINENFLTPLFETQITDLLKLLEESRQVIVYYFFFKT